LYKFQSQVKPALIPLFKTIIVLIITTISSHVLSLCPAGSAGSRLPSVLHDGPQTKCMCFSTAVNTPSSCCFRYQTQAIPVKLVAAYAVTELQCTKSGIIFILKDGRMVCADPDNKWVKNIKNRMDQRLSNSLNKPTKSV
ncbi:hypothetical protein QTP70_033529, partial [Hemibagrus guttatus]